GPCAVGQYAAMSRNVLCPIAWIPACAAEATLQACDSSSEARKIHFPSRFGPLTNPSRDIDIFTISLRMGFLFAWSTHASIGRKPDRHAGRFFSGSAGGG